MMHLSQYMDLKGLKDQDVATGICRSRVTVSRIRRRKVRPDWDTIEEIRKFTKGAVVADDFQIVEREKKKVPASNELEPSQ